MSTNSENRNTEETLNNDSPLLSRKVVQNITGLPAATVYPVTPDKFKERQNNEDNNNYLRPKNLVFEDIISSSAEVSGIRNFTAYNDYIHHTANLRWNVFNNLISGAVQWEVYSRKYR